MVKHVANFQSLHTIFLTDTFNAYNLLWYRFPCQNHSNVQNVARPTLDVIVSMTT